MYFFRVFKDLQSQPRLISNQSDQECADISNDAKSVQESQTKEAFLETGVNPGSSDQPEISPINDISKFDPTKSNHDELSQNSKGFSSYGTDSDICNTEATMDTTVNDKGENSGSCNKGENSSNCLQAESTATTSESQQEGVSLMQNIRKGVDLQLEYCMYYFEIKLQSFWRVFIHNEVLGS